MSRLAHVAVTLAIAVAIGATGCAMNADLGVLQRRVADGTGGSLTGHLGVGMVPRNIVAVQIDSRLDVAASGSRFGVGASVLGGLPIGPVRALGRAGLWAAAVSSSPERTAVPTFELAVFVPLYEEPEDPKHRFGPLARGVVVGVREDLDVAAYTTIFVGVALFIVPGY